MPTSDLKSQLLREYLDLPGLSLTLPQVSRLLSTDAHTCRALLDILEDTGCLTRTADDRYVRSACHDGLDGWIGHARQQIAAATRQPIMMPSRMRTFVTRRRRKDAPTCVASSADLHTSVRAGCEPGSGCADQRPAHETDLVASKALSE